MATATSRMASASSASMRASYQRDIQRAHDQLAKLQTKRAAETSNLARKQGDVGDAQKRLMEEQTREHKKSQDTIRRLESELGNRSESIVRSIRTLTTHAAQSGAMSHVQYAAFISHASEDKDDIARPLAEHLRELGHEIWYDEFTLRIGDSLRRRIDQGLASSRYGIVILSPSFFAKNWPQRELDGLVAREMDGAKVILPLWHKVSKDEVLKYSPPLADKLALSTAMFTVGDLALEIHKVLMPAAASSPLSVVL